MRLGMNSMNDVGDHPRSQACFSLTQLEETDFTLNQSETEQQFEDKVFSGFSDEFGEKDGKCCFQNRH